MYTIVNVSNGQVVPQKGQTALTFSSLARVDFPDANNSVVFAASPGFQVDVFKIFTVTEVTSGSGPIVASVDGPTYASNAVTITTTRRAETQQEIDTRKNNGATSGLGTVQNKTLFDALWELHRAIRGQITLPTETKAQYSDRLKAMWVANEP